MKNLKKSFVTAIAAAVMLTTTAAPAFAANGYTLDGDASVVPGGNPGNAVKLTSDADPGYGAVEYTVSAGTTFATLDVLSTDFMVEADDVCFGGSPRFQITVPEMGPLEAGDVSGEDNIFVYFEPHEVGDPLCTPETWISSGDLLEAGQTVDTSQLGGTFYHDYADTVADFGTLAVSEVSLVVDAGWGALDGEQTVLFDNTNIDGTVYTYEPHTPSSKDACKKGGWQTLEDANGNSFKNQGQCVSYFNHQ